jgi:hypothetical protein
MIERIEALCEAATPGPWNAHDTFTDDAWFAWVTDEAHHQIVTCEGCLPWEGEKANAAFIAHARQLLPLMLAEIEAHRALCATRHRSGSSIDAVFEAEIEADDKAQDLEAYCAEHLPEKAS